MALIEARNLAKIYSDDGVETPALRGASLKVEEGEFVAVMGPSGSGKSTLLHILGFLDRPTGGEYYFAGRRGREFSDDELAHIRNEEIGFVFQDFNLLARATVLENVELPLLYSDMKVSLRRKVAEEAIEAVGIGKRKYYATLKLSGGERQKVAIARAIVNNPKIVFADEPTGNLDSKSGEVIMGIIQELNQKGHTIVLVTHESYPAQYAMRILTMSDGRVASNTPVKNRLIIGKDQFLK